MIFGKYLKTFVCIVIYFLIFFDCSQTKADWNIETLDSDVAFPSMTLDSNGNPHISYYGGSAGNLSYAYYSGSWHYKENIDLHGQRPSLVLDSNDNPHISYFDYFWDVLKYAHYDGSWHIETVNNSSAFSGPSSIALDSNNNPHIGYYDNANNTLEYTYFDGSWHTVSVDDVYISYGLGGISIALDSNDNPRISYSDNTNDTLKYTWCDMECHDSSNWHNEVVDSGGAHVSLVLDSNDNPHISYRGILSSLKYAHYENGWHKEEVDTLSSLSEGTSITLDANNNPHISFVDYIDYDNEILKYAYYDGTWNIEVIEGGTGMKYSPSLKLGVNGNPHVCYDKTYYYEYTNTFLKYAFKSCPDDYDCDGTYDNSDNCPTASNPSQEDSDADGAGDICDNCPTQANGSEGGSCSIGGEPCIENSDCSTTGYCSMEQEDADDDGVGNVCDNCPSINNPEQEDMDKDGIGNVCDNDLDGDELLNEEDNCPRTSNPGQEDNDRDGFGDFCDSENSFALIDNADDTLAIFDLFGELLYERKFDDLPVFVSSSVGGWLVKGNHSTGNWTIWDLKPDLSIRNIITNLTPGPLYAGLASGNFVSGNPFTGIIDLYSTNGTIIKSTNVWEEEGGLPFHYKDVGDIASLRNGGFVVPPEGGYPDKGGGLYTPYLYFYDNNLNLMNAVDITSKNIHLFVLTGLSDGGFAATCADYGTSTEVEYLCFFTADGELLEDRIILPEEVYGNRYYEYIFLTGLNDGRVMVSRFMENSVWIYDHPSSGESYSTSQTEPFELNLSGAGISSIGSVAGNTFLSSLLYTITGRVMEASSQEPIVQAIITTDGGAMTVSDGAGEYEFLQKPGRWWLEVMATDQRYNGFGEWIRVEGEDLFMQKDIFLYPYTIPVRECINNEDCSDRMFCNGIELCMDDVCQAGSDSCPDDGLFCNGEETCDEAGDNCISSGNPCPENLRCDEEVDACVDCTDNAGCDDGLYCNGLETCENGICQAGSSPCPEGVVCDEESEVCNNPYITVTPQSMLQSRWIPLPIWLRINGTHTHFDGSSEVTFSNGSIMALTFVWGKEMITCIGLMMPSLLTEPHDGSIEVSVTSTLEEVSATIEVKPLLFMFDQEKTF